MVGSGTGNTEQTFTWMMSLHVCNDKTLPAGNFTETSGATPSFMKTTIEKHRVSSFTVECESPHHDFWLERKHFFFPFCKCWWLVGSWEVGSLPLSLQEALGKHCVALPVLSEAGLCHLHGQTTTSSVPSHAPPVPPMLFQQRSLQTLKWPVSLMMF